MLLILLSPGYCLVHANDGRDNLQKVLEHLVVEERKSAGLVGLGAAIIQDSELLGLSVDGERKKGSKILLSKSDRWHLGSITKSITATMIARLIEKGELDWNTRVTEIFPNVDELDTQWRDVTLENLLTHTSGAVPNFSISLRITNPAAGLERKAAREAAVINVMRKKPKSTPGSAFMYSNVGYTIAGAMAEKKTGLVWEELVRREIFVPLQIQSGGFGPPQDEIEKLEQPRGHKRILGFTISAGEHEDNTSIMGPAGSIHLSLNDLALFVNEHLQGELGNGTLLTTETFRRLHRPVLKRNAYGWVVSARKHLGVGPVIWHSGTNTMWYALQVFVPDINAVIVVTSNDGDTKSAQESAWEIVNKLAPLLAQKSGEN